MKDFGKMSKRISSFREELLSIRPEVCVERALLTTKAYREHEMEEVARTKNMHGFYVPVSISKIDTDARYLYQSTDIIWKKIGSPELDVLTDVIDCFYLKRKHYSDTNDTRLLDFGAQTELTVSDIVTESLESVSIAERYYYIISFEDHPCLYADESVVKDADGNFYLGIYIDKGYDEVYLKVAPEYVPIFEDAVESLNAE